MWLTLIKNWKVLGGIGFLIIAGFFIYDYTSMKSKEDVLESQVIEQRQSIKNLESRLEQQKKRFENEYQSLEKSMQTYQESLKNAKTTNNLLREELSTAGDKDENLEECLNSKLPDDIFNRLSK